MLALSAAPALAQSSNTSSNRSSNNGVVRERIDSSYCEGGWCDRVIERRVYRDDQRGDWRDDRRRDRWERNRRAERRWRGNDRRWSRDDDD